MLSSSSPPSSSLAPPPPSPLSSSSSSGKQTWRFECFLNAGNGRNLKDFLILRSDCRFVAACDFGGFVYVWNTDTKRIMVSTRDFPSCFFF